MGHPKQISNTAKGIFIALLEVLAENQHLKIDKGGEGIMPLTIERINTGLKTPWGTGCVISLAHYYELNGDLMRDPEITYLVVDNRPEPGDFDLIGIWPAEFTNDGAGVYHRYLEFNDGEVTLTNENSQHDAATFSTSWFNNLKWQQEITPAKKRK